MQRECVLAGANMHPSYVWEYLCVVLYLWRVADGVRMLLAIR